MCDSAVVQFGQSREFICSSAIICKEKEDKEFQQNIYVKYSLEDFIYLLDVMISVYDKDINIELVCIVI